jgi:hypothetical protein
MKLVKGTALLLIILPLLGSIFSCLYFWAVMRGTFTKWEILDSPPKTPVKLLRINYVQTVTGDVYEFQHSYNEHCANNCWMKVDSLPPILNPEDLLPLKNCQSSFDLPSVARFSDSVIECWRWGPGIRLDAQAIDHDGKVLMWQKGQDDFGDPLMLTSSPIFGAVGGFLLALLFFVIALVRGLIIYWPRQRGRPRQRHP